MTPSRDYYLPERRLVSQDDAAMIQNANVPRSKFTGSWTRKTTFNAGFLVPFLLDEILPGDHMSYAITAYIRMATPLFPIFDEQRVDTFLFFIPNRLLWENWTKFMGEQATPASSIAFTIPQVTSPSGGWTVGSIGDHMGLPTAGQMGGGDLLTCNVLPFRAYNLVYNQWFRDQNIIDSVPQNMGNGPDSQANYVLRRRAKSHDYFTSALPWPQKFTAPNVPVAGNAPIIGLGISGSGAPTVSSATVRETVDPAAAYANAFEDATTPFLIKAASGAGGAQPQVYADLSQATGVAINTFRQAFMIQTLLERDARGGTRYVELIRSHFGVTNPDFRLQRPEYIGGGQTRLNVTPIAQTVPTASPSAPLGALGGTGTAVGSHRGSYAATEHGYILGLINVRTELSYQQGVAKIWRRLTRFDFYWPSLAQLGEQAILKSELFFQSDTVPDEAFGYQERWHEYRVRYSEVAGRFRSTATGTIDQWHLAQRFVSTPPSLNAAFIEDTPPMARVLAAGQTATDNHVEYLADILINRTAVRPIPTYGTPATLGRF